MKTSTHRERGQLQSRKKLGALEKHKDYVKRAEVRHKKVNKMHQLKRAAAQHNPDEFNLKMTQMELDPSTGKMKKKEDRSSSGRKRRTTEQMSANKKDLEYLRFKMRQDRQQAIDLSHDVIGLDMEPQNKHTIFVDTEEGEDVKSFDVVKHFNTTSLAELAKPALRSNKAVLAKQVLNFDDEAEDEEADPEEAALAKRKKREAVAIQFREVAERTKRYKQLKNLSNSLDIKQQKLHNTLHSEAKRKYKKGAPVRNR